MRDGRIAEIGPGLATSGETIEAGGLLVIPGIIDPHTHLDGQLFWAPDGSSSSWHGVTTVVMGNCGYTLAPVKPEDREYIIYMFGEVEEIAPEIFQKDLPWNWVTFGEYLDAMDKGLGVNVVALVGHSTLRSYVMGDAARERAATEDEVAAMQRVLRESVEAGAFGLATSRAPSHYDGEGRPVPSRLATEGELLALADTLRELKAPAMELNPQGLFSGLSVEEKELIATIARRSGATIQLNGANTPDTHAFIADVTQKGAKLYGVQSAQPFYKIFSLNSGTTNFNSMDTWFEIIGKAPEERRRRFADPVLRPRLREEVDAEATMDARTMRRPRIVWDQLFVHKVARPENKAFEGVSIPELAARQGKHKADALLDLAMSEAGETQFLFRFMPESSWLADPTRPGVFNHPYIMPTNSDAGAHIASECKSGESSYFLRHWVIEQGVMSLEEGVRRLTGQPAAWLGLNDRGVLREGKVADIVVLDPAKLDTGAKEPVNDLPRGGVRWIQKASGIEHVLVSGEPTLRQGRETAARPARVLRSAAYRK
jgi:N-acyl-D-aspartate/D-glutamate deacylase